MFRNFLWSIFTAVFMIPAAFAGNDVQTLIQCDFRQGWGKLYDGNNRISGELPNGWKDDTSWCRIWAKYSHETFQSTDFLRVKIDKVENGRQQLSFRNLPEVPPDGGLYRLRIKARSHSGVNLNYGLRMSGEPYQFYWQHTATIPGEWQIFEHNIQLNPVDRRPMGLWFNCSTPGDYELAEVVLEKTSVAQLAERLKQQYPNGGPANLFRNSVFPLGLQNGWSLGRNCSDGDMVKVTTIKDNSGAPALQLTAPEQPAVLFSEPFQVVEPELPHLVRLYVRGSGKWTFTVRFTGKTIGSAVTELTSDWKAVDVPFRTSIMALIGQLRIDGRGTLELKSIAAGPVTRIEQAQPGRRPEVALALPESSASAARIQFCDEPAAVRFSAMAAPVGTVLQMQVCDLYGNTSKLKPQSSTSGIVDYAVAPELCGTYRIEAFLELDGKVISPYNEIVVNRLRRPAGWNKDLPESSFGIHTLPTTRHLLMAKAAGFNWARLHDSGLEYVGWWNLEKEKGKWTFFDNEIKRYRQHKIEILGEFGTAPGWASYQNRTVRKDKNEYHDKFFQPLNLPDYGNYVKVVSSRYKDVIHAWDVWNEPWINGWWGIDYDKTKTGRAGYVTSKTPGQDFARLMQTAYQTAKAVDPKLVIMGFNTSDNPADAEQTFSGTSWTSMVMKGGGLDYCDRLCYHCYTNEGLGYPNDSVSRGISRAFTPLMEKYGKIPKAVWMTEGSPISFMVHNGMYKYTSIEPSREDMALVSDRCCRYIVSLLANRVEKFFLYSMHCHTGEFSPTPADWRILTNDDGYMHPSGVAIANLAGLIDGLPFVKLVELKKGVYAYVFSNGKRSMAAISGGPDGSAVKFRPLPDGVAAADIYGNPPAGDVTYTGRLVYIYGAIPADALESALQIY